MKKMYLAGAAFAALGVSAAFAGAGTGSVTHDFVANTTFNYTLQASANVPAFCKLTLDNSYINGGPTATSAVGPSIWAVDFGDVSDSNFNLNAGQYAYVQLSAKCNLNKKVNWSVTPASGKLITNGGADVGVFRQSIPYLLSIRDSSYVTLASMPGTAGAQSGSFGPGSSLTTGALGYASIELTPPGGPLVAGSYAETIGFTVFLN